MIRNLTLKNLDGISKKANRKVNDSSHVALYVNVAKKRLLMNLFFASQFNYCPSVWMCHHCSVNNKINCLHEWCLPIVYSDSGSSFEDLLDKDNSVPLHVKNEQSLAIEMLKKTKTCLSEYWTAFLKIEIMLQT